MESMCAKAGFRRMARILRKTANNLSAVEFPSDVETYFGGPMMK